MSNEPYQCNLAIGNLIDSCYMVIEMEKRMFFSDTDYQVWEHGGRQYEFTFYCFHKLGSMMQKLF